MQEVTDRERDAFTLMKFREKLRLHRFPRWQRAFAYSLLQDSLRESAEFKDLATKVRDYGKQP